MKNVRINISVKCFLIAGLLIIITSSCQKHYDPDFTLAHQFKPGDISITTEQTKATLSWDASLYASATTTYTVQVSKDSTFATNIVFDREVSSTSVSVTDSSLQPRQTHYARVKANASGATAESGWVKSSGFSITGEQLFLSILDDYLTDVSVQLRWKAAVDLTKIVLTPAGGSATGYNLTSSDVSAAQKTISGLTPATTYSAEIYKGTASKGIISFTTKSATPTGANVVNVGSADDLAALLAAAVPNTIFVLGQGTLYKADAEVTLPANASFTIWGQYGPNRAVIAFNGLKLPATAGTIRFENLDFTGYQNNDASGTKRNYIFNQSAANTTESIEFENCIIRNLTNTPFRLQGSSGQTINNLKFNKCIAYDIGDNGANGTYAFIHTNVATGKVNNIRITNSTLYKIGYSIILHNAAPSLSVTIENCTFDNTVGNGRYFIDYNAQSSGTLQITNVIIGKSLSPAGTANGIRTASAPAVTNSFQVSNTSFVSNAIPGISTYSGANTDLFTNPSSGDFLIKDQNFSGKSTSGDPRWRL